MKSFVEFLREFQFADLHPRTGEWERVPTNQLVKSQHAKPTNIDTELFDLLDKSYSYIGGHVDFKKPSDLPANHQIWYAIDINGDKVPDAVEFAKDTKFGRKWTGGATSGTPAAKQAYISNIMRMLTTSGNYCEMSDAIMHIMITRYHVPYVPAQSEVEKVLGKKVEWIGAHPDGKYPDYHGFYERELGGELHMKILLGRPRL